MHLFLHSDFIAKTQNPSVRGLLFEELIIINFVDGDRDKMLPCAIRAIRKHLSRMEQYCPGCANLFVSLTKK